MTTTHCEAYRGWHIWFESDGGYVIGPPNAATWEREGYYTTREDARKDIDWHVTKPVDPETIPDDSPSLDQPWWAHR